MRVITWLSGTDERSRLFCTQLFQIEIEHGFQLMFISIIRQYSTYGVFFWRSTEANFIMYRLFGVSHKRNAAQTIKVKFSFLSFYLQSPLHFKGNICNAKLYRTQVTGLNGIQLPALSVIYADMAGLSWQPGWNMCGCVCARKEANDRPVDPLTACHRAQPLTWHLSMDFLFIFHFFGSPTSKLNWKIFVCFLRCHHEPQSRKYQMTKKYETIFLLSK